MAIRVDVYTIGGTASGVLARSGALRDVLAADERLQLERTQWQGLDESLPRSVGTVIFPTDDILFAVADDDPGIPIHAAWHHVILESGPYVLEGELATMPGFDPGRSLARPTGQFVLLRDIQLSLKGRPEAGVSTGDHALVNRYAVERIQADLMLGFFFPGAAIESAPASSIGLGIAQPVGGAA